ncbi:complex I subunit 5 family protein [Natronospora cellulosivora (SeqCode)]
MFMNLLIVLPLIIPILGVIFLIKFRKRESFTSYILITTAVITFLSVLILYPFIIVNEETLFLALESVLLFGISFRIDVLAFFLALVVSFIWILTVIYSLEYMKSNHRKLRFYIILLLNLAGTLGFFFAGDILTMFIFFELLTILSYLLVIQEESPAALKAGNRYIFLSIAAGLGLLFSIIITYINNPSLNFVNGGIINVSSPMISIAFFVYILSFGIKAGIFPFHVWLPEAHPSAPSPASAILSGVMIKIGAYGMLRTMYNLYNIDLIQSMGWNKVLLILAAISIFLGSAAALFEKDIKRRLAYSSIGQMGYILLGMSLINEFALIGDIFHIFSHIIMKTCLFLAAGAIIYKTGIRDITKMAGIGKKMPITMLSFTIAALAMIGIPPMIGFISKWELSLGAMQANYPIYVVLLLLSSLMNAIYYLPIIINAFFTKSENVDYSYNEVPWKMLYPMVVLASSTFVFNLLPKNIPLALAKKAAAILFTR